MAQIHPFLGMNKLAEHAEKICNNLGALCGVAYCGQFWTWYPVLIIHRNGLAFAVFQQ